MTLLSQYIIALGEKLYLIILSGEESVGQRAAELLAVRVRGLPKKSAASAIRAKMCASTSAWVRVHLGSNHSQNLTDCNFEAF